MRKTNIFIAFTLMLSFICGGAYTHAAPDSEAYEIEIPIIMYHAISEKASQQNKFVISAEEFESDLRYLQEKGYETVVMSDLIDFVNIGAPMPEKPVLLTFDDGAYSIDKYARPLLEKYNMRAVVSIIGSVTDKYSGENRDDINYPNLTWAQVNRLIESGYFEIQNHSYDLHKNKGAARFKGESEAAYEQRLREDLVHLQARITEETKTRATTFTYPFGAKSSGSDKVLKNLGFSASLCCLEKTSKVRIGDEDSLFSLGRYVRPHGVSSESFFGRVLQ